MKLYVPLLALLFLTGDGLTLRPRAESTPAALEIEVQVAPSVDRIHLLRRGGITYECRAIVRDANGGRVHGEYVVTPAAGRTASKHFDDLPYDVTVSANVTARADRAEVDVTVKRGDQVVGRHRSAVMLQNIENRIIPLQ